MPRVESRAALANAPRAALVVVVALTGVTVLVALVEGAGVADASAAYLLAVVSVAVLVGTWPSLAAAIGAFFLYDFLFIEPRFTLTVSDPTEWLNLLLLLVVGLVVGRLAGRERDRAETAIAREREARALFRISFALARATDTRAALPAIIEILRVETVVDRVWIVVGDALVGDSGGSGGPPRPAVHAILSRRPGDEPSEWTRVHVPATGRSRRGVDEGESDRATTGAFKVVITAGDREHGAIWVTRPRSSGPPGPGDSRVLSAAADQIAGSLERDRLRGDAMAAEIARRSDALKSALLDSVSHDLRTPMAAIRAAAGALMDPAVEWPVEERREMARSIDREATWLDRLITNLLDMSRLEAGQLRPELHVFDLDDLISDAVGRTEVSIGPDRLTVDVARDLPPVRVDEVYLAQALANVLDNAAKYAGPASPIRITARGGPDMVAITIEDGGTGVPDESLDRVFEKFYRVPRMGEGSRRGTGIGLAVVRGLVEAMGGRVTAARSPLGGLAVTLEVPSAPVLADVVDSGT